MLHLLNDALLAILFVVPGQDQKQPSPIAICASGVADGCVDRPDLRLVFTCF
jgi:hypothetical protein